MLISIITLFLCVAAVSSETRSLPESIINSYDQYMTQVLACQHIPAAAVAVVKFPIDDFENPQWFSKIYENPEFASTVVLNDKTPFCVGEITQSFTTMLYAELVERGLTEFDSTVSQILKIEPEIGPFGDLETNEMTSMRLILSHQTGIPSFDKIFKNFGAQAMSQAGFMKIVRKLGKDKTSQEFRDQNSFVFGVLAPVISNITGKDWKTALRSEILSPIGIDYAIFIDNITDFSKLLPAEIFTEDWWALRQTSENYHAIKPVGVGGSLCLSVKDMLAYLNFLLSYGEGSNGAQLLQPATLKALFAPEVEFQSPQIANGQLRIESGTMGWLRGTYKGETFLLSEGEYLGYRSIIMFIPSRQVGVFVSLSGSNVLTPGSNLELYMAEYFLSYLLSDSDYPLFNQYSACALNQLSLATSNADCSCDYANFSDANLYVGDYTHEVLGKLKIYQENKSPELKIRFGRSGAARLCPWPEITGGFWLYFDDPYWNQRFRLCRDACLKTVCDPPILISSNGKTSKILTFNFASEINPPVYVEAKDLPPTTPIPFANSVNYTLSASLVIQVYLLLSCSLLFF